MTASAARLLITFATAWGPRFGGINAFNHDLLLALAPAYRTRVKVVCVVLHATPEQCQAALSGELVLVPLGLDTQQNMTVDLEPLVWRELQARGFAELPKETVWLGHDRITGAIALQAAKSRGGRAALIHHMSYAHYEAFAESSASADLKAREQGTLFNSADHAMAIGPLLRQALAEMLDCPTDQTTMLVPGLADIQPKQHHHNFNTFVSGRLDPSTGRIKQGQLSVAAFGHAVYLCDRDPGLPDKLRGEAEPSLTLRGVDFEHVEGAGLSMQEADLRRYVEGVAQRAINLRALPFTEDRNVLFDDLRSASLCLMPSWHEGFGLVAWEAIAAGVPLIASKKSGVVKLLSTLQDGQYMQWLQTIDVRGQTDEPFFRDDDKAGLSKLVIQTAKDHGAWKAKAARLRESLLQRYSWRKCAEDFVTAIGWQEASPVASLDDIPVASASQAADTATVTAATPSTVGNAKAHAANSLHGWLDPLSPRWESMHGLSPAQLLRAEEALLPFAQQAEPFLAEQLHWAHADELPLTVRLLVAQGGSGKTRLAIELCSRLRHDGWLAGFLVGDAHPGSMTSLSGQLRHCPQPVCIVVDYAETRTAELLALLGALLANPRTAATRILLLARSGGEWWQQLPARDAHCEALLMGAGGTGPYVMPSVYPEPSDRDQAFQHALQLLTTKLRLPMPAARPDLRGQHFARPLYVQLAALMTALGERAESAEALPRALLNHEQRYWSRAMHSPSPEVAGQDAVRLMALATMLGEVPVPRNVRDTWAAAGGEVQVLSPLFHALIPLYPGRQGLQGLRPDMVGEALVAHAVLSINGPALLNAVLGARLSKERYAALTVLARASKQRADLALPLEDALERHFARCASEVFRVCLETTTELPYIAKRAYLRLAPAVAQQIAGTLLPSFESEVVPMTGLEVEMRRTVHDAAKRKADKRNATVNDKASFAAAVGNLGEALRRDGKKSSALQYTDQARLLFTELVRTNQDRYEPDWATMLNNYASHLGEAGRTDEALAFAQQALGVHHRLALDKPERYEPDWARSLNNYSNCLVEAGRTDEALVFGKRALDIHHRLALDKPELYEPNWTMSLNNYANHLSKAGRSDEALAFGKQALDIRQRLALGKPERYEPNWATSLSNYANHLSDVGRTDEALALAKHALDIRQRLALGKPERYEPDWAMSLSNYASQLSEAGRTDEALAFGKQALDIHHRLALGKPERYEPDWATSLGNYANYLGETGRTDEALAFGKQALDIRQRLASDKPERYDPDWATSLSNYANHLSEAGRTDEALTFGRQALDIRQRLALDKPRRYEPDWATSLSNYAHFLSEVGRTDEALAFGKQALDIRQRLASGKTERYEPDLATSLSNYANHLSEAGRTDEALGIAAQATETWERLAVKRPKRFGAAARLSSLQASFLKWLVVSASTLKPPPESNTELNPYSVQHVAFAYQALLAIFAQDAAIQATAAAAAFAAWRGMHRGQRQDEAGMFVLLTALSASHASTESNPPGWEEAVDRYYVGRHGRLPAWLLTACLKLGAPPPRSHPPSVR